VGKVDRVERVFPGELHGPRLVHHAVFPDRNLPQLRNRHLLVAAGDSQILSLIGGEPAGGRKLEPDATAGKAEIEDPDGGIHRFIGADQQDALQADAAATPDLDPPSPELVRPTVSQPELDACRLLYADLVALEQLLPRGGQDRLTVSSQLDHAVDGGDGAGGHRGPGITVRARASHQYQHR
jgi:hypothetical protein